MANHLAGVRLDDPQTVRQQALGNRTSDEQGRQFVYVLAGSGGLSAFQLAAVNKDFTAVAATTTNALQGQVAAVAPADIPAGNYGWVQNVGACTVKTAGAVAANVRINTTATAGSVDDDGTTGAKVVEGLTVTTAIGAAGNAQAYLTGGRIGATL